MTTLGKAALLALSALLAGCSDPDSVAGGAGGSAAAGGGAGSGGSAGSGGAAGSNTGGQAGAAGAPAGPSDLLCGVRPGGNINESHVLRFESADGDLVVQIQRTWAGAGVGESQLYRLDGFGLVQGGVATCVSDASSLEYVNSHHNWTDVARAQIDGVRYELAMLLGVPDTLGGFDGAGAVVLPVTPVHPTGSPAFCWSCPASMPVSISEVMLNNVDTHPDEAGEFEPWIELFNPSSEDVDLTGWTLSDDFTARGKWALPAVTLPLHTTLLLFADGDTAQGELHTSFTLAPGAELVLTAPDGTTDGGFVVEPQNAGQSLGYDWAAAAYVIGAPTPGAPPPE